MITGDQNPRQKMFTTILFGLGFLGISIYYIVNFERDSLWKLIISILITFLSLIHIIYLKIK